MMQVLFVRITCDLHEKTFGETRSTEREVSEINPAPPWLHEITVDGYVRQVFACPECWAATMGNVLEIMEQLGEDPPGRRRKNTPPGTPAPERLSDVTRQPTSAVKTPDPKPEPNPEPEPGPESVTSEPPGTPIPEVLFQDPGISPELSDGPAPDAPMSESAAEKPTRAKAKGKGPGPKAKAGGVPKSYPCPLCNIEYLSNSGLEGHLQGKHRTSNAEVFGTTCHLCGKELESWQSTAPHYGTAHRGDERAATVAQAFIWARENNDPHGTVQAAFDRAEAKAGGMGV